MFGEKAFELIKELDRSNDNLPPFNVRDSFYFVCEMPTILFEKINLLFEFRLG